MEAEIRQGSDGAGVTGTQKVTLTETRARRKAERGEMANGRDEESEAKVEDRTREDGWSRKR